MATIRFATLKDISALTQLDEWPSELIWQQKVTAQEVLVLESSHIIGLVRFTRLWTTVPFIGLVYIESEHRGKGYSRLLLNALITHLQKSGAVALLSSSQTDEPQAQAWHVHMGFHSNGIIENIAEDNVGELVYRLEL